MNHKRLQQTLRHAVKYPLPVRIAAALHLQGVTAADYHAACLQPTTQDREYRKIDYVIVNAVFVALRDIERGFTTITQQLRAYAEQINV